MVRWQTLITWTEKDLKRKETEIPKTEPKIGTENSQKPKYSQLTKEKIFFSSNPKAKNKQKMSFSTYALRFFFKW